MSVSQFKAVINECRRFCRNEISSGVLDADLYPDGEWVKEIWAKSIQCDLPVLCIPEKYDGAGYSEYCCALVLDVLSSECAGLASVFANHYAACLAARCDNDIDSLHTDVFSPSSIYMLVMPDSDSSDPVNISEKDGALYLNGASELTGNVSLADKICVFARDTKGNVSYTCVFIDSDTPGILFGEDAKLSGLKANPFKQVLFNDINISPENIIGKRGEGGSTLKVTRKNYYSFISAMAMGASRTAIKSAIKYAENRYQFGKKIIHHQEIQRMLGNMMMQLQTGTSAYLSLFDKKRADIEFIKNDASLVKAFCTDAALSIVIDAIQIHGGYGYMHEYGLEKKMRDVKVLQLLSGKNPCHHIDAVCERIKVKEQ